MTDFLMGILPAWAVYSLAVLVGIGASARLARLLIHDTYPPIAWVRRKWDALTHDGEWAELVHCHYCATPYIVAAVMLAAWLSDLHTAWWVVCAWLTASYVAAWVVSNDGSD